MLLLLLFFVILEARRNENNTNHEVQNTEENSGSEPAGQRFNHGYVVYNIMTEFLCYMLRQIKEEDERAS